MLGRNLFIDALIALFGLSTWLSINGVWAEMPLLVPNISGSWSLPSYLSLVIQFANVGPALYILLHYLFPKIVTQKGTIFFVLGTSIISIAMFVQLFSKQERSGFFSQNFQAIAFFSLTFVLAQSVCLSRILHIPFMSKFKPTYLTSFFIGEGLANFVPSVLALAQGINTAATLSQCERVIGANFSISIFFLIMLILTVLSTVSFILLNVKSITKTALHEESPVLPNLNTSSIAKESDTGQSSSGEKMSKFSYLFSKYDLNMNLISLLLVQGLVSYFCNGVLPAIQSYACLPYGVVAYHLAVNLSHIANPVTSVLIPFLPNPSKKSVAFVTSWSAGVIVFILVTAVLSPNPPLAGFMLGTILMVTSWVLLFGQLTYVRVSCARLLLESSQKRGLLLWGIVTQIASLMGAASSFLVVNYTNIFKSFDPCFENVE